MQEIYFWTLQVSTKILEKSTAIVVHFDVRSNAASRTARRSAKWLQLEESEVR